MLSCVPARPGVSLARETAVIAEPVELIEVGGGGSPVSELRLAVPVVQQVGPGKRPVGERNVVGERISVEPGSDQRIKIAPVYLGRLTARRPFHGGLKARDEDAGAVLLGKGDELIEGVYRVGVAGVGAIDEAGGDCLETLGDRAVRGGPNSARRASGDAAGREDRNRGPSGAGVRRRRACHRRRGATRCGWSSRRRRSRAEHADRARAGRGRFRRPPAMARGVERVGRVAKSAKIQNSVGVEAGGKQRPGQVVSGGTEASMANEAGAVQVNRHRQDLGGLKNVKGRWALADSSCGS